MNRRNNNILYRISVWIKTFYYFLFSIKCVNNAEFLTPIGTVREIKSNKKSLIRFGDGEFNIISGKGIRYQAFSEELQFELKDIIERYIDSKGRTPYHLALPSDFLKCNGLKLLKKRVYVASWSFSRWFFKKNYDRCVQYGDAFLFAKEYEEIYRYLWEGVQTVIFVHNDRKYAEQFSRKYKINTKFVQVPNKNAYEKKEDILSKIYEEIRACGGIKIVTLVSAGPCGKVLVKELSDKGYLAYDTGHCWDNPLELIK
ncbi:hypothetical protein B1690_17580 [Geobacillus sp. 46C-IIa]|uniref:GT-D fold domain-containing glycosyltransferase n=1 Tax=Geobacillus sp. 46C-IIa TaxID=1963025 RepID=UPI0009BFC69C|nr:GT-D fold domain-containing glycosyltransferase [Geobacillus sp. 46C-IIa]OQP03499.1 hypothetical protein B1690_17580 [Geobacillus sp. 46C-IIa]QNU28068.1 DUF1792 domain-containing protein [Geobacillus sp. 46C-IIa]